MRRLDKEIFCSNILILYINQTSYDRVRSVHVNCKVLIFSGVYEGYIHNEMWHLRADFVYKRLAVLCLFFFGHLTCSSAEDCVWSNWTELTGNDSIQHRLRICGDNLTIESRNCDYDPCNGSAKQGICRKQKFQ